MARSIFAYITIFETDMSAGPWITIAFFAFACGETIRYPYYFFKCLNVDRSSSIGRFFGHLRYNFFIVFYPIGAFCDLMTGYYSKDSVNIKDEAVYSLLMPNKYNFCFDFQWFVTWFLPITYALQFPVNYGILLR